MHINERHNARRKTSAREVKMSDRAELLLGLVRESCQFDGNGELQVYFVPRSKLTREVYGEYLPSGIRPYGSDASTFKSFERRGLVRKMPCADYAYVITEEGIVLYEQIAERRRAGHRGG